VVSFCLDGFVDGSGDLCADLIVLGKWALKTGRDRMPLSYTLRAVKE
jgi:hypothetical protein